LIGYGDPVYKKLDRALDVACVAHLVTVAVFGV
jgi:hypothetical protein